MRIADWIADCAAAGKYRARRDRALVLLDAETGETLGEIQSKDVGDELTFSPDGSRIATASPEGISLWQVQPLKLLGTFFSPTGGGGSCVAFSPDGELLASGDDRDEMLRLWHVASREELLQMDLGQGYVRKVVFSADGEHLRYVAA